MRSVLGLVVLCLLCDSQEVAPSPDQCEVNDQANDGHALLQMRLGHAPVQPAARGGPKVHAFKVAGVQHRVVDSERPEVIVDTNVGFFDMTLDHYRAFESLLWQYPSSNFVLLKIAPDVTKDGYQYRNSLPSNIFQKYSRMGYHVTTRIINGHSVGPTSGSPGAEWWNRYGVKLATALPPEAYYMDTGSSPEVSDESARLFIRLWQALNALASGSAVVFSDLTLLLTTRPHASYIRWNASSGDHSLPLLVLDQEVQALSCALSQFDAAAKEGKRSPDMPSVRQCFADSVSDGTHLSVSVAAEHAAGGELGLRIKHAVRDAAPSEYFLKSWQASASSGKASVRNLFTHDRINSAKICPAIVIPGFMKAGSTSVYNMLVQHPLLLSQHKGAHGFSEGNLFWDESPRSRVAWSPVIEEDEPFQWFDVSVFYSEINESQVLERIRTDCDHHVPPILWLLREPVSMMMSAFRFMQGNLGNEHFSNFQDYCDKVVSKATIAGAPVARTVFEVGSDFEHFLHSFQRGEALSEYFSRYFELSRMDKLMGDPLRWKEKLPDAAVLFTSLEEWTKDPIPIFDQIFKLIGLPTFPVKTTHSLPSSDGVELCRSCFDSLEQHFAPLKKALIEVVGRDIDGWFPAALPHHVTLQETC